MFNYGLKNKSRFIFRIFHPPILPMERIFPHIIFLWCLLGFGQTFAQEPFIENKGQWPEAVAYRTNIPGGQFYVENGGILFNLYDTETTNRVFAAHSGSEN